MSDKKNIFSTEDSSDFIEKEYREGFEDDYDDNKDMDRDGHFRRHSAPMLRLPSLSELDPRVIIAAGVILLSIIFSLISIVSVNKLKVKVDDMSYSVNAELQSIKETNAEMIAHLAALEQGIDTAQNTITGANSSKYIPITKQPTSTPTTVGRDEALIFEIKADGKSLTFVWQKYDDVSGDWINLVFDLDGNNSELGIRLYDDSGNGLSQLWAKGLTTKAFGSYRCLITDGVGAQVKSDTVQITEKTAE